MISLTVTQYLTAHPAPAIDWSNTPVVAESMKQAEQQAIAKLRPLEASIKEYYRNVTMRDGAVNTIKVIAPARKPAGGSPLIALIFGGGWVSGSVEQITPQARALVRLFDAVVVSIDYRLAPQHMFPIGQNDCWDSLKWIAAHADELEADPEQAFIVGGVSAGGTNSVVAAALAIEEPLKYPLTGQLLSVPVTMSATTVPEKYRPHFLSREHNRNAPFLTTVGVEDIGRRTTGWEDLSPLRHVVMTKTPLSKLPPTYLQACGMDPMRDDALIFDEMLKTAGVRTKLDFYPGCPHAFWMFIPDLDISKKAMADMMVQVALNQPDNLLVYSSSRPVDSKCSVSVMHFCLESTVPLDTDTTQRFLSRGGLPCKPLAPNGRKKSCRIQIILVELLRSNVLLFTCNISISHNIADQLNISSSILVHLFFPVGLEGNAHTSVQLHLVRLALYPLHLAVNEQSLASVGFFVVLLPRWETTFGTAAPWLSQDTRKRCKSIAQFTRAASAYVAGTH
nr:ab hydrolase superfamily protein b1a11.02 [Quercus suber]